MRCMSDRLVLLPYRAVIHPGTGIFNGKYFSPNDSMEKFVVADYGGIQLTRRYKRDIRTSQSIM